MNRGDFRYFARIGTRWADCDPYGHVNNIQYYSYFDTALTTMLIARGILQGPGSTSIGLCVESQCRFHEPLHFPAALDVGVRIGRLGDKSIRFELAIFAEGSATAAATGHFVHVYVDAVTHRPVSLGQDQRDAVKDLVSSEA